MLGFPSNTMGVYQSPMIQNMGGMGSMPPTYNGNLVNVGGIGYNPNYFPPQMINRQNFGSYMNSPYYTNNYSYNNPYALAQQQKAMEAARNEEMRKQTDTMKAISRMCHKALGDVADDDMEEYVNKQYDRNEEYEKEFNQMVEDVRLYLRLGNLRPVQPNYGYLEYCAKVRKSYKDKYPDDMSLAEFLENAGELYRDSLIEMNQRKQRDGKLKYSTQGYKDLVALHRSSSSYFNSALTGKNNSIEIGDLEFHLPTAPGEKTRITVNMPAKIAEYNERRNQFIEACLNSGRKKGGGI